MEISRVAIEDLWICASVANKTRLLTLGGKEPVRIPDNVILISTVFGIHMDMPKNRVSGSY